MAIRVKFDSANRPLPARLILATKSGRKIRELPINNVKFHETLTDGSEFSFNVYKNRCVGPDGQIDEAFWKRIVDFRLAYCPEYDQWYELDLDISESTEIIKAVQATSLGKAELSQINIYGMEVNTEADIERADYAPTVLYDPDDASKSLIDRLLNKAPHYRIKHVDDSIAHIQRTFQFDSRSIDDCFIEIAGEINCLFIEEATDDGEGGIDRAVSAYDLESSCMVCGYRGDFMAVCPRCGATAVQPGYGNDTSVFVSRENLASEITYATDADSVKNCFRLEAGDDLMTSTIIGCNPNGSQYIWNFTDDMKADMSEELRTKLDQYDERYEYYQNEYAFSPPSELVTQYNEIVDRYDGINQDLQRIPATITGYPDLMTAYYDTIDLKLFLESELMPNVEIETTDAAREAAKLTMQNLVPVAVTDLRTCTAASASAAVLSVAQCLVRATFQVKTDQTSYDANSHTWSGRFIVTNYGDEEDTATTATVSLIITEDFETYLKRKIQKTMHQASDDATDIASLFELPVIEFSLALNNYSLQRLTAFRDACQAALNMLIQQGAADESVWASAETDLYNTLYLPYLDRMQAIEGEMYLRSQQIGIVDGVYDEKGGVKTVGMQRYLAGKRKEIQNALDFEAYLGEACLKEFASFRREDTYSNPNYISDGLNNDEIFNAAKDFIEQAKKDLYKSSRLQHSISSSLSNLLSIREFHPIIHHFAVGNWIRMKVDGEVYRLRIKEYSIDYDSWNLSVTFSDLKIGASSANDIEDLLSSMRSMSTSYGLVTRQAKAGKRSQDIMDNWVAEGFKLTTKIVGGAENQEFIIDESGITGREYIPETEGYKPTQIKIISDGLYVTNDGWRTARAGIGRFAFWNPQTQRAEEAYGVIADTIVGSIVLSEEVGIYNKNASITLDRDGFTLIADAENNEKIFRIQRRESNGDLSNVLSIDSHGQLQLDAYSTTDEMNAAISVSASGIRTEVSQTLSSYSTTEQMNSKITQTANTIRTEVSNTLSNYSTTSQMNSKITQTANTIRTEVSQTLSDYSTTSQMNSAITQSATAIRTEVSQTLSDYSTTSQMNSAITQSASEINTEVAKKVGASEIISKINQTAETVKISASKINLSGYVTISSLGANGTTTVDGGRIHGGTLILGGASNGNGSLRINDSNDNEIISGNSNGLTIRKGKIELLSGDNYDANGYKTTATSGTRYKRLSVMDAGSITVGVRNISNSSDTVTAKLFGFGNGTGALTSPKRLIIGGGDYDLKPSSFNETIIFGCDGGAGDYISVGYSSSTKHEITLASDHICLDGAVQIGHNNRVFLHSDTTYNAFQISYISNRNPSAGLGSTILSVDYTGNSNLDVGRLMVSGTITATGSKSRVVQTEAYSKRKLYCYETPTPMFGDIGDAVIDETGTAYIFIDSIFAETVETSVEYQVFLQKYGSGECYVSERQPGYFVVTGDPGTEFGWEIKAKQRDYDQLRLDKDEAPFIPETNDYGQDAADYIMTLEEGRIAE